MQQKVQLLEKNGRLFEEIAIPDRRFIGITPEAILSGIAFSYRPERASTKSARSTLFRFRRLLRSTCGSSETQRIRRKPKRHQQHDWRKNHQPSWLRLLSLGCG